MLHYVVESVIARAVVGLDVDMADVVWVTELVVSVVAGENNTSSSGTAVIASLSSNMSVSSSEGG